ncbi:S1 family peptidase [Streptomyces paromomycinus]|uniref:Serine protease n=1 Tax=Streptomyces paromomycinus TaxID=92743 RepID=A0A401VVF0_STREY|nr:S1 family peptidase [Streptomyces paromomycinus]GCD41011.1 serine protease [Streptomyces paromomycinus]
MQRTLLFRRAAALAAATLAVLTAANFSPFSAGAVARAPSATGTASQAVRAPDPLMVAMATLDRSALIPGTAWGIDPQLKRVVVSADPTVKGARLARLTTLLKPMGKAVELRRTSAKLTTLIEGGDAIHGRDHSAMCSLGFNVRRAGVPDAFLTAGHCGNLVRSWAMSRRGPQFARTVRSSFPGNDYALARYTAAVPHWSAVDLHNGGWLPVTGVRDAVVGDRVARSGATTGTHLGSVTALNQTVTYQEGRVYGLIRTNVCAEPGDSGGPLFTYDRGGAAAVTTGLGLLSGGSGDCSRGGTTYYQPVTEALTAYGADIP